jgi:hypothetical protein
LLHDAMLGGGVAVITVRLTDQQSARIAELPAEFRVVGVDQTAPLVRRPAGRLLRIQPNGRLVAATIAARRTLALAEGAHEARRRPGEQNIEQAAREAASRFEREGPAFATPYTAVLD